MIDLSLMFIAKRTPPARFIVWIAWWVPGVPGAQVEAQSKLLEEKARGAQEMASELEVGPRWGRLWLFWGCFVNFFGGLNRENWSFFWRNCVYLCSSSQNSRIKL